MEENKEPIMTEGAPIEQVPSREDIIKFYDNQNEVWEKRAKFERYQADVAIAMVERKQAEIALAHIFSQVNKPKDDQPSGDKKKEKKSNN